MTGTGRRRDEHAVVLLHGFGGTGADMVSLAGRLPGRVIAPDLPGHGSAVDVDASSLRGVVDGLVRSLDAAGLGQVDVVGYSMGGRVALAMTAWVPDRVRSVVAIGGRAGIRDTAERDERRRRDDALADAIESRGIEWFVDTWLDGWIYDTQRRLGAGHMEAVRRSRIARSQTRGLGAALRGYGSGAQPYIADALARCGRPVVLLVGELDHRFAPVADELGRMIPGARVVVVPEAGHATHVENLDGTAAAIVGFLSEVRT